MEHFLREWRSTPPSLEVVSEFLLLDPVVGPFPWLDFVEQALDDVCQGERDTISLAKVAFHTSVRKRAYERWSAQNPNAALTEFSRRYAVTVAGQLATRF